MYEIDFGTLPSWIGMLFEHVTTCITLFVHFGEAVS